ETGSERVDRRRKDDGDGRCNLLQGRDCSSDCDDDVNLEPHELGPDLSEALAAAFRPAILDRDRAAFDPAQFAQSLDKRGDPKAPGRKRACTQESDSRQLSRLLRARRERPRGDRAAEQRDEVVPFHHSITLSARTTNVLGTSWPIAFAVLRLMTSSNLVGCSTGRSPG